AIQQLSTAARGSRCATDRRRRVRRGSRGVGHDARITGARGTVWSAGRRAHRDRDGLLRRPDLSGGSGGTGRGRGHRQEPQSDRSQAAAHVAARRRHRDGGGLMSMDPHEMDELLGAYALDAVDDDERRELDEYLASNPRAQSEVQHHREVATYLAWSGADAP